MRSLQHTPTFDWVAGRVWRSRWTVMRYLLVFGFVTVFMIVPFWMVVVNSLKPQAEAAQVGLGLPTGWEAARENYKTVVEQGKLLRGLRNTLLIVIPGTVSIVILGGMASWIFGRSKSLVISIVLYYISISGVLIPPAPVPAILVMKTLGIHGTRLSLVFFYLAAFTPFAIFLMTGFVKTIPVELEEAARIDGASNWTIFWRIIMPMMQPVVVTVAFIMVVFMWNEFFYVFYLLPGNENQTLMLGLYNFVGGLQYRVRYNLVFADLILVSMPLLVLFVITQRYVVSGLMGSVSK